MSRRTETAYKAKFPGELAQHNEAQRFRGYGKCCGCVAKVHVLIRGDLSNFAVRWCIASLSGESAGRGDRLIKSRRYKESIPPDIERLNKGERLQDGER